MQGVGEALLIPEHQVPRRYFQCILGLRGLQSLSFTGTEGVQQEGHIIQSRALEMQLAISLLTLALQEVEVINREEGIDGGHCLKLIAEGIGSKPPTYTRTITTKQWGRPPPSIPLTPRAN